MNTNLGKHNEAIESYVNGNISDFRKYLKSLTKIGLVECMQMFFDIYPNSFDKIKALLQ